MENDKENGDVIFVDETSSDSEESLSAMDDECDRLGEVIKESQTESVGPQFAVTEDMLKAVLFQKQKELLQTPALATFVKSCQQPMLNDGKTQSVPQGNDDTSCVSQNKMDNGAANIIEGFSEKADDNPSQLSAAQSVLICNTDSRRVHSNKVLFNKSQAGSISSIEHESSKVINESTHSLGSSYKIS